MKNSRSVLVLLAVASTFCRDLSLLAQDPSAATINLGESANQANFPAVLQPGMHNYWSNGYLITIDAPPFMVPDKAGVILYDRDGVVARQPIVWLEGAKDVSLTDVAVSRSGNLVVGGGAMNNDGAVANFIAEIGSDDRIRRIVRTTPFVPAYVCALDDGTVWAYGFDRDASLSLVENSPRLRQYSFDKGQLQAKLVTSTLPDAAASRDIWRLSRGRYPGLISLRCNSKMVVLYNGGTGDLVEYDLQKNQMTVNKVAALPAD